MFYFRNKQTFLYTIYNPEVLTCIFLTSDGGDCKRAITLSMNVITQLLDRIAGSEMVWPSLKAQDSGLRGDRFESHSGQ